LLDVFIQSTKWQKYSEELLFERIGLNDSNLAKKEKRRILKKAFFEFNEFNKFNFTFGNEEWKKEISTHVREISTHQAARNTYGDKALKSI
jgi:DNA-binding transcriptional regulator GbsR (MarR family)